MNSCPWASVVWARASSAAALPVPGSLEEVTPHGRGQPVSPLPLVFGALPGLVELESPRGYPPIAAHDSYARTMMLAWRDVERSFRRGRERGPAARGVVTGSVVLVLSARGAAKARPGPCSRALHRSEGPSSESTRRALRITVSKITDAASPQRSVPPFSHNNIRQRQAREATRRARRCPAPARLPTARPAVARARVAGPASRREARSTRTGPQRVDTAEPEPRRRVASAAITSATFKWPRLRRLRSRAGSLADRGASMMSRGHGLPLAAPRATGSPVKRYTAFRVLRRALT